VSAIVVAAGAAGDLVRTVDSVLHQGGSSIELLLAAPGTSRTEILDALTVRAGARVIVRPSVTAAVNVAGAEASGRFFLLIPAGVRLDPDFAGHAVSTLQSDAAAVAPLLRIESPDTVSANQLLTHCKPLDLLVNPSGSPRAVALSSERWRELAGLDESAGELALYEIALRASLLGPIRVAGSGAVSCRSRSLVEWPPAGTSDDLYLERLRYVLCKHEALLRSFAADVLVAREAGFGRLRDRHRTLVERMAADSHEITALREEAAHHRAWLEHRGETQVDWGDLRRTSPVSRDWGYDRGTPVDRRYIDEFLALHSSDVHGTVLEVQENDLTLRFGGPRVDRSDIVDLNEENKAASILADLRCAPHIPANSYDCVVLTQTLHVIDDMDAVLAEVHRILKPGGVVLATLPAASRSCLEYGAGGDLWRVTPDGARSLFARTFDEAGIDVSRYGNVLTNVAFLHGLAAEELRSEEFDIKDPYFPALTGVRARKTAARSKRQARGIVLLYHRIDDTSDAHQLNVTRANFRSQLDWLREHCSVLPLDELLTRPIDDLPERAVALTFDDGYLDNLQHAAPLLQEFGLPATFFLTTAHLDQPGEFWWDLLARVFDASVELPEVLEVGLPDVQQVLTRDRTYARETLHRGLVDASLADRNRAVDVLRRYVGTRAGGRRPLVADEVAALARLPGVSIGAHTVNHLSLPRLAADAAMREMEDSREALERVLGRQVHSLAYPYGALDGAVADAARRRWRWACACGGYPLAESFDAACVWRIEPGNVAGVEMARRIEPLMACYDLPMSFGSASIQRA
jgi:peptidoglycan/xylan/chitin deacetylase (PgdA/CDA1 family)